MNIQIFGKSKCFDTKKAERWFKERRIKYQLIDVAKYGMSRGEYASVKKAVGGMDKKHLRSFDFWCFFLLPGTCRTARLQEMIH